MLWIILLFPMNCVDTFLSSFEIVPQVEPSHLPIVLCARAFRADTGHSDSGDEWSERFVWDKQKENDFVAHLSTSSSLDEATRATTELDVSVDSALNIFVANILSAAECMKKHFKRFGCKKHKSPWLDNDCLNARSAARKSLQRTSTAI